MTEGKYTVNEVEDRTQVPASTLRQWERRYGFPKPERSPSGYRLYSDEDVVRIERMKHHIAEGIPASRAAELVKRLQEHVSRPKALADFQRDLVQALTTLNENQADKILSEAYTLHRVEDVLLHILQRAMIDIGQLWHDGHINVTTEHFASSYVEGRLRSLLQLSADIPDAPAVIVACAPEEQHELGALVLAVMLRRAGFQLYYVGANTPIKDLCEMVETLNPIGVMISASNPTAVQHLLSNREHLVDLAPITAFGGRAFNEQPSLAETLGGVYLGKNASEAVSKFRRLVLKGLH